MQEEWGHGRRPDAADPAARLRRLAAVLGVMLILSAASATHSTGGADAVATQAPPQPLHLGPRVKVFDPSMPTRAIQATLDAVARRQAAGQFGRGRYALLFEPGVYGTADRPLTFRVGYYTEVAGLGRSPDDVTISGSVNVVNRCTRKARDASRDCTALDNFWRSMSNLRIDVAGGSGCRGATEFWAVSQGAPLRRVDIHGTTSLVDYCSAGSQYASGGFIADSAISSSVTSGTQQQFYTRNSTIGGWSNAVWNQVFSGVHGAPAQSFPSPPYTTLATTPVSRERPCLYVDRQGRYQVFVPAAQHGSTGTSWQDGRPPAGRSVPLRGFYVAKPSDPVSRINRALAEGRSLLFSPGVYDVARTIEVTRPRTVVLGLGLATVTARRGVIAMSVADVPGVDIAGLVLDAGPVASPVLLRVGSRHHKGASRRLGEDPISLQDVFFRVGGPHVGKARVSLEVNSDHTVLDDVWAWRADHGYGVGWAVNTAETGVVVNGDDVTATGLFVEHYQKQGTVWNGERGRTVFYQSELPHDVPNQAAWRHGDERGYAAYKVAGSVRQHEAWGLGAYIYTTVDPHVRASNAFEVPVTPGVRMHDLSAVSLNGASTIDHVINGVGAPVRPSVQGASTVTEYPAP